jgi:hypothetical protein
MVGVGVADEIELQGLSTVAVWAAAGIIQVG